MRRRALALALPVLLIAASARAADPPPAAQPYQSPSMRIAGIVLTSVAAASVVAGSLTMALTAHASSDAVQNPGVTYGGLALGTGVLLGVIGVPMWVVGSRPRAPSSSLLQPEIAVGPLGGTLRWSF